MNQLIEGDGMLRGDVKWTHDEMELVGFHCLKDGLCGVLRREESKIGAGSRL